MTQLLLALFVGTAFARPAFEKKGFLEIRPGHKLYTEYKAAEPGKPTLFLLNGLTYSTKEWSAFVQALLTLDPGLGIVLYDMEGMGKTLDRSGWPEQKILIDQQVQDLEDLRDTLAINGPTVALGLSYGGAVALNSAVEHPNGFNAYIAMAPFLERLPEQDEIIQRSVKWHRLTFPFDPRTDDDLYDCYLRVMVAAYPITEPIIDTPMKLEAVYRMVQGAKDWNASKVANRLPAGRVHIVAASGDEYVKYDRMEKFLQHMPKTAMASLLVIQDPPLELLLPTQKHHKIPELRPAFSAAWVYQILTGNPDLQKGLTFWGDPSKGEARSGQIVIPLERKRDCQTLLRKPSSPR